MTNLEFTVLGVAAPQGSKRHVGKGVLVESSKAVGPWRDSVAWCCQQAIEPLGMYPLTGPLRVHLSFWLRRPKAVRKAEWVSKRPDLDKLVRSTLDGLTMGGAWVDDAQVADLAASKKYVYEWVSSPCCSIYIAELR